MRKMEDEVPEPCFCVYVLDKGEFKPISYGDSELECKAWIKDHEAVFQGLQPYIGMIMDNVTLIP